MSLLSCESSFTLAEAGTENTVLIEHISTELWWLQEWVRGCMQWESLWHEPVLCQTPFLALWVTPKRELKIQEKKKFQKSSVQSSSPFAVENFKVNL